MLERLTEFFRPALQLEQAKFFKQLEKEVDHESAKQDIADFDKEALESYEYLFDKDQQKLVGLDSFKKNRILANLNRAAATCAYKADIQGFKKNLYAMSTLASVPEVIGMLQKGFHKAWYDDGSDTVSRCVLKGIHIRTAIYYGDTVEKKEKYLKSGACVNHKKLIDILKRLGLSEALVKDAQDGEEERDHRLPFYQLKVPQEILEYISSVQISSVPTL